MKGVSDVIQKLEGSKVDLGENPNQEDYVYTEEMAQKSQDQGNVELVELRQTTKTIQCQAYWKHIPEGMVKCYCGTITRLSQSMMDEIQERLESDVDRNGEELLLQEDRNVVHNLGKNCTRKQKMHHEEPRKTN